MADQSASASSEENSEVQPTNSDDSAVIENGIEEHKEDPGETIAPVCSDVKPKTDDVAPSSSIKKKKKKKKKGDIDTVDGADDETVNSNSTKDMQIALRRMMVDDRKPRVDEDEKSKKHEFWETQPVPKLGEYYFVVLHMACDQNYSQLLPFSPCGIKLIFQHTNFLYILVDTVLV